MTWDGYIGQALRNMNEKNRNLDDPLGYRLELNIALDAYLAAPDSPPHLNAVLVGYGRCLLFNVNPDVDIGEKLNATLLNQAQDMMLSLIHI